MTNDIHGQTWQTTGPQGRPVVLLDVDGVLNARDNRWGEAPARRHVRLSTGEEYRISWAPDLVKAIRGLASDPRIDLVWLTSWGPEVDILESLWGLPELTRGIPERLRTWEVPDVKLAYARRVASSGRPWVWCDDEVAEPIDGPGPHLAIRPSRRHGLTPGHIDAIRGFLAEVTEEAPAPTL